MIIYDRLGICGLYVVFEWFDDVHVTFESIQWEKGVPLKREESYQLNNTIITYINSYLLFYDKTKSTRGMWIICCL